jgi:lipopolysaccharide biosynthesis glycosyltransferase
VDSEAIPVAFASDAQGVEGLAVTGFSALETSSRPLHFWIIEDRIPAAAQRALEALWRQRPAYAGATFVPMASLPLPMPSRWIRKDWPLTSAARFQLAEVLPASARRCIYLDIDILVGTDLAELYGQDLAGEPIGMVPNTRMGDNVREYLRGMDLDPDRYCNAGVLLIDLEAWRREGAGAGLIACGLALPPTIWFFDQDMLNTYFKGRCRLLDERWNLRDAAAAPAGNILHFAGRAKPWSIARADVVHAGHLAWYQARDRSGFKARPVPAWLKWRKTAVALLAKVQRRLARA